MIISCTQRSASTVFCGELAKKLGMEFGNQIIDGLWKGYMPQKATWHEYKDGTESENFLDIIKNYRNKSNFVIQDHSSHPLILNQAKLFVSRKNLLGSTSSIRNMMMKRPDGLDFVSVNIDWHLRKAFDLFSYCYVFNKHITWTDNIYKFTIESGEESVCEQIDKYIRKHDLYEIVNHYNLITR